MTAQPASPTVTAMSATATADAALATHRPSAAARSRYPLVLAALLALAGAGFTTARSLAEPEGTRPAPVCSETCGPLTTTEAPEADRLGDAVDPPAEVGVPNTADTATSSNRKQANK
jgi:hypothetical protein